VRHRKSGQWPDAAPARDALIEGSGRRLGLFEGARDHRVHLWVDALDLVDVGAQHFQHRYVATAHAARELDGARETEFVHDPDLKMK